VKAAREEEWHPSSVTPLPVQVGSLTVTSPKAIGYKTTIKYLFLKFKLIFNFFLDWEFCVK